MVENKEGDKEKENDMDKMKWIYLSIYLYEFIISIKFN